jgi:hypothetical protein
LVGNYELFSCINQVESANLRSKQTKDGKKSRKTALAVCEYTFENRRFCPSFVQSKEGKGKRHSPDFPSPNTLYSEEWIKIFFSPKRTTTAAPAADDWLDDALR